LGNKLLIVEDNDVTRAGLATLLRRAGFDLALAADGQQALDYLKAGGRPDVILLDMLLPVLDGWHFLERLQEVLPRPVTPVLVVTGIPILGQEWVRDNGCAGVIHKPIEFDALLTEIRRLLSPTPDG
jgi:CheY-like chemotaxis protein